MPSGGFRRRCIVHTTEKIPDLIYLQVWYFFFMLEQRPEWGVVPIFSLRWILRRHGAALDRQLGLNSKKAIVQKIAIVQIINDPKNSVLL